MQAQFGAHYTLCLGEQCVVDVVFLKVNSLCISLIIFVDLYNWD